MSMHRESGNIGWLQSLIGDKKSRIANLLGEIAALGSPGSMKPSIFRKFLELLSQVAREQESENDLITRIEDVERQHRFRRDHNQLEHANPDLEFIPEDEVMLEGGKKRKHPKGLRWFFDLWNKPEGPNNLQKKQDLT